MLNSLRRGERVLSHQLAEKLHGVERLLSRPSLLRRDQAQVVLQFPELAAVVLLLADTRPLYHAAQLTISFSRTV